MRQVRAVLRLKWAVGLSERQIAYGLGIRRPTVAEYLRRAHAAGISWPLPASLDEMALERWVLPALLPVPEPPPAMPEWSTVPQELQRKGVTLFLLWQADKAVTPEGLQSRGFCQAYQTWSAKLELVMRQSHHAGEKLLVDDAGQRIPVVDAQSGESREATIFMAVLGASNSPYVEATWTHNRAEWIGSHVRALAALGGVPAVLVPDTLTAAVTRAHRYEPALNRTSVELAQHYGGMSMPARAAKPRDKAQVAVGVQIVERWMLARLRHPTCFTLGEVHTAIGDLLPALKVRPFKKLPGSRQELCAALDRPALRPLPLQPQPFQHRHCWTSSQNVDT